MRSIDASATRWIGMPGTAVYGTLSRISFLKRLRYVIEATDWDKKILDCEKQVKGVCIGFIIASMLYFVPVLIFTLSK